MLTITFVVLATPYNAECFTQAFSFPIPLTVLFMVLLVIDGENLYNVYIFMIYAHILCQCVGC